MAIKESLKCYILFFTRSLININKLRNHEKTFIFTSFIVNGLLAQEKVIGLFTTTTVDDPSIAKSQTGDFVKTLQSAQLLKINISKSLDIKNKSGSFLVDIPTKTGNLNVLLEPADILAPGFKVMTPTGEAKVVMPTFFKGRIIGKAKSFVALTVTAEGNVEGMLQDGDTGYTIGKIKDNKDNLHIVYESKDIKIDTPIESMPPVEIKVDSKNFKEMAPKSEVSGCRAIGIYLEADFQMYTDWGGATNGTTNVTKNMTGIFNQVAILYANEAVKLQLSQLFIWTTTDPYAGSANNTSSALSALDNYWNGQGNNFNGNICHMVTTRSLGGGVAYLYTGGPPSVYGGMNERSVFYACGKGDALGLSANITNNVTNVPTYSWNVEVIAHEIGHNCGLPHTQSCTWPGGAQDNCYGVEGSCSPGPVPVNGGTIMSYCHLSSPGINFNNCFGLHPGSKLRAEVAAATCLGGTTPPDPVITDGVLCSTGSTTLNVSNCSASGVIVNWYSTLTGTSAFHTGTSYTTPSLSVTTDYFVDCSVSTTCVSQRKKISATFIIGSPAAPTGTQGGSVCGATGASTTISASGCMSGADYQWYNAQTGGILLFTRQNFTTPILTAEATYYAACAVAGCGVSTTVAATVSYIPVCPYCIPGVTNCNVGDGITGISFKQGATTLYSNATGCISGGFSYTNISSTLNLAVSQTYALTITNPGLYPEGMVAWIDYDKDQVFGPSEIVLSKNSTVLNSYTQSFAVPGTLLTGTYRVRIRQIYARSTIDPCLAYGYARLSYKNIYASIY